MLALLRHALSSPVTGAIALAVAVALVVTLGVANSHWQVEAARYEARIAELTRASAQQEANLRTQLNACQAAAASPPPAVEARYAAEAGAPAGARRLLEQQPEGFDACARMESADRAVLSNLKP
jgi:Asp/Glu/hydantoin racemase